MNAGQRGSTTHTGSTSADEAAPTSLFTYGTLMFPEIIAAVIGRAPSGSEAVLRGYSRFRVHGQVYPGVIEGGAGSVPGLLYEGLSVDELRLLDEYEGRAYERRVLPIRVAAGTRPREVTAYCYVVPERRAAILTTERWDPQDFAREHRAGFRKTWD